MSAAVTSILTDGNAAATNSFAVEQVLPSADYVFTGPVTVTVQYATQPVGTSSVVTPVITQGQLTAVVAANGSTTPSVERATANAITAATALSRFGDVSGIVRAWSAGTSVLD